MDEFAVGLLIPLASMYGLARLHSRLSIAHVWNIDTRPPTPIHVGQGISTRNVLPLSINHAFQNFPSYSLFTIPWISLHSCHFFNTICPVLCCSRSQFSQSHILSRSHCYPTLFVIIASSIIPTHPLFHYLQVLASPIPSRILTITSLSIPH